MTTDVSTQSTDLQVLTLGNIKVRAGLLKKLLPDIPTALFYAKAVKLDYHQLTDLLWFLFKSDVLSALTREGGQHSTQLQDYIVNTVPDHILIETRKVGLQFVNADTPELLAALFDSIQIEVAQSISDVVATLSKTLDALPTITGEMVFATMAKLNKQRANTIGTYGAQILHRMRPKALVILDVSGSMSSETIHRIVDEVIALAYEAQATLAIVSDDAFAWAPGTATAEAVLSKAQFSGTHYEQLKPLLDENWNVVITIADYDSSVSAKRVLARCSGHIDQVLDISLVNEPTYLAECVGQLADDVRPVLMGNTSSVLS